MWRIFTTGIFERIKEKQVSTSNIFRYSTSKRNLEESTSSRISQEYSSEKEDKVCLKFSHKEDDCEVTKLLYKKLFKLNAKLIKEHDKIEKCNVDLKDYIEFLEKSNEMLKYKVANIRNQNECLKLVSQWKWEWKSFLKHVVE